MPEVQNVGAVDYSQYQPSQYQYEDFNDGYNTQPQIYNENAAEVKNAAKSKLGATALAAIIIGGGALWGGYALGKKAAKKELPEIQNNAADKYKEFLDKFKELVDKQTQEIEKDADEVINTNIFHWKKGGKFAEKVKEELKKFKEAFENFKKELKESGEKVADDGKKAADEAKNAAEDKAKGE